MLNRRKALVVGIDYYTHPNLAPLSGCVNDALEMKRVLETNHDGSSNFDVRLLVGASAADVLTQKTLSAAVRELFSDKPEIALLYFAGHGYAEDTGGYLCTGECEGEDDGLSLEKVMTLAKKGGARNKLIILDSCHSGSAGDEAGSDDGPRVAKISEGMTILAASPPDRNSMEVAGGGAGVFTTLLVDALEGAAANLIGQVTAGSAYAHIDQLLGSWAQRPMFKTHVEEFVSLRTAEPSLPLEDLRHLKNFFPSADHRIQLGPEHEPERSGAEPAGTPPPDPAKNLVFARLQRYARVNLVRPVDAPHMWHAAMGSKWCELTVLGRHYRKLKF